MDTVPTENVIFWSGEHKTIIGTLTYYLIKQFSVKAGTVYRTHISDDRAWNVLHVTGCFVLLGRIVQLQVYAGFNGVGMGIVGLQLCGKTGGVCQNNVRRGC